MMGFFLLAEDLLAYQEGLCSIELFIYLLVKDNVLTLLQVLCRDMEMGLRWLVIFNIILIH
jgi:hypothetical protein